uniref:Uncharacterized protein n=1 Tax=Anguilla anguilla TaxID=7936 RepID=A0A0E9SNG2_ANGAN
MCGYSVNLKSVRASDPLIERGSLCRHILRLQPHSGGD